MSIYKNGNKIAGNASPISTTANLTDVADKRLMTDAQKAKLDAVVLPQKYNSGTFSVAANTEYTLTHNLGTSLISYRVLFSSGSSAFVPVGAPYFYCSSITSTTLVIHTSSPVGFNSSGNSATSGLYKVLAEVI